MHESIVCLYIHYVQLRMQLCEVKKGKVVNCFDLYESDFFFFEMKPGIVYGKINEWVSTLNSFHWVTFPGHREIIGA